MTAVNDSPNFAGNRAPVMTGNRVPIFTGYAGTRLAKSSTDWLEDTSYTINASELLAGWLDPDGDVLKVANLSAHVGDLKDNGNGTYTLTPPANYFGTVVLSYQISDGFSSAPATRYLAVSPVNDAPTLSMFADAVATGIEDRVITITLANLRNQGDEDDVDDNVSAFMVKEVNNGTLK
ncbi:cadherin-like domain-containing protein, partial [Chromatium okenii]|uniref:cadherin-like domain-containing protein n=1 Tax=Chromatium okenii TaxID=61644 RepID=UPI0026EAB4EB